MMYVIIVLAILAFVFLFGAHCAPDFEQTTGYDSRCFSCNETDCNGCVVTGPCYGCTEECTVDCPFDPILGQYHAENGHYVNADGKVIGTYTKGE
jgi:hypothetical protein